MAFGRSDFIKTVGSETQAMAFEDHALSISDEYLPECAKSVRDGGEPSETYWQWLANEYERAN